MFIWILFFLLAGCNLPTGQKLTYINSSSIADHTDGGVIVCDCVAIFDAKLAEIIEKMSSQDYFKQIGTISKVNKNNLLIWRFDQFPNQSAGNLELVWTKKRCAAKSIMFFADYRADGEHKAKIERLTRQVRVVLGADKIETLEQKRIKYGATTQQLKPSDETPSMNLVIEKAK